MPGLSGIPLSPSKAGAFLALDPTPPTQGKTQSPDGSQSGTAHPCQRFAVFRIVGRVHKTPNPASGASVARFKGLRLRFVANSSSNTQSHTTFGYKALKLRRPYIEFSA